MTNKYKYKYDIEISNFEDCPPKHYQEIDENAYRFVKNDINHPNNFLPVLLIKPKRINSMDSDSKKCQGYGLSLFNSKNNASKKLRSLINRKPNLANTLASCVAEGKLEKEHGVASEPNSSGHFTFHEYDGIDLGPKFKIILKLDI